ncbi:MAG: TusE/DsrC/DsvC family sulfur relay protein [Parcubacteria group bacterium]
MPKIGHNGKTYEVDEDGFLITALEEWDENWARYVMSLDGIVELTPNHQKVLDGLWEYYKKNGLAPMTKIFIARVGFPLKRIYELFPSGLRKGACKMLGMRAKGCNLMM